MLPNENATDGYNETKVTMHLGIEIRATYTEWMCGGNLWSISVTNRAMGVTTKISREQFFAMFSITLPKKYDIKALDSVSEIISEEWGDKVVFDHNDAMDIS